MRSTINEINDICLWNDINLINLDDAFEIRYHEHVRNNINAYCVKISSISEKNEYHLLFRTKEEALIEIKKFLEAMNIENDIINFDAVMGELR